MDDNERVTALIDKLGYAPQQLASELEVSQSAIYGYMKGNSKPNFNFLQSLIYKFPYVNLNWLVGEHEKPFLDNVTEVIETHDHQGIKTVTRQADRKKSSSDSCAELRAKLEAKDELIREKDDRIQDLRETIAILKDRLQNKNHD